MTSPIFFSCKLAVFLLFDSVSPYKKNVKICKKNSVLFEGLLEFAELQ